MNELTPFLAVWGATLSAITLIWNLWKWIQERPRIVANIRLYRAPAGNGISLELRNRGSKPTTVEEITLIKYAPGIGCWLLRPLGLGYEFGEYVSTKYRTTAILPTILNENEVWKGSAPFAGNAGFHHENKEALIEQGELHYSIRCAHTNSRIKGKVRGEQIFGTI